MQKCNRCGKVLKVGCEVHIVDEHMFCSDKCAIEYTTDEIICNAKEVAKELYSSEATVVILEHAHNNAICATCGKDLATCETIWAAEGFLFCSRKCGVLKYAYLANDPIKLARYAEEIFDARAEEITPQEIGLEVTNNEMALEVTNNEMC